MYGFFFINNFNNNITDLKSIGDMNYNVDRLIRRVRVIAFFVMEENSSDAETIRTGILETIVRLETKYMPVLVKYTSEPTCSTPVLLYYNTQSNGSLDSTFVYFNGYELMSSIILWSKELFNNTSADQLILNEQSGNKITNDYR